MDWYQKYLKQNKQAQKEEDEAAWQEYLNSLNKIYDDSNKKHLLGKSSDNLLSATIKKKYDYKNYDINNNWQNYSLSTLEYNKIDEPEIAEIDKKTKRRISRGNLSIEDSIDLHGESEDTAFIQLARFIDSAKNRGLRVIKVITGRGSRGGEARIKKSLPGWLQTDGIRGKISRYSLAGKKHGGEGAFYIILKK